MGRSDFLYAGFISRLKYEATSCQDALLRKIAAFVSSDESDILVVNGYAGTGKTTAVSAVISVLKEYGTKCILLAKIFLQLAVCWPENIRNNEKIDFNHTFSCCCIFNDAATLSAQC